MQQIQIKHINYGIACRKGNDIYINSNLMSYPELYYRILEHEKEHSDGFNINDFKMDLTNKHLRGVKLQYYNFILRHPKSWIEFLPFWFYEGKFAVNPLILLMWGILIIIIGIGGLI